MSAKTAWKVSFTHKAENDVLGIVDYIADREGADMADAILDMLIQARNSLHMLPDRGRIVPELKRVNILSYREIQASPYRMIYQVNTSMHAVFIHMVADGRRNFAELLKERLLNPSYNENNRQ
ncbi:MAG: hypothetical protein DESF_01372 [Desulfovibrio sp.]